MTLTYEEAKEITGTLSYPSKMPCPSWGIDPKNCVTGAKLRAQKGTTCSICYACKGHFCYPLVRQKQAERLQGTHDGRWVEAMIVMIKATSCRHFRWFDSGDLQGSEHLLRIFLIALRMPDVQFWLPTQEHKLVHEAKFDLPANLTIRLTNYIIDPIYPVRTTFPTAEVITCSKEDWDVHTTYNDGIHHYCPADGTGEKKCGACRACWDKSIQTIMYRRS